MGFLFFRLDKFWQRYNKKAIATIKCFEKFLTNSVNILVLGNFQILIPFLCGSCFAFIPIPRKKSLCFCLNQVLSLTPSIVNMSSFGSLCDCFISASECSVLNFYIYSGEYSLPLNPTGFIFKMSFIKLSPNPKIVHFVVFVRFCP